VAINNAIRLLGVVLLAGLAAPVLSAQEASDPTSGGGLSAVPSVVPAVLSQGPARAPKVTCAGGQLTISANNATLGSVLAAVHACIGVQIDVPAGAGGSRTFEELGPGPERQVLEALLSGTNFNYVIGSSDSDPGKVETVLLMERPTETAANAPQGDRSLPSGRRGWMGAIRNAQRAGAPVEDNSQSADEPAEAPAVEEPAAAPTPPENVNATPAPASDTPAPAAEAPPTPSVLPEATAMTTTGSPAPELSPSVGLSTDTGKSTADRITEMQQMFQQRKQISQGQSSVNAQPQ
jgi:hypothetical protein